MVIPNCLLCGHYLNSINENVCEGDMEDDDEKICGRENVLFRNSLNIFGMCGIKHM